MKFIHTFLNMFTARTYCHRKNLLNIIWNDNIKLFSVISQERSTTLDNMTRARECVNEHENSRTYKNEKEKILDKLHRF